MSIESRRAAARKGHRTRRRMLAARGTEHVNGGRPPRGTIPPGAVGPAQTRIMLALLVVYARDGRATVRAVAAEADRSVQRVQLHLTVLDAFGLVRSDRGTQGSLRPLFAAHLPIHRKETTA